MDLCQQSNISAFQHTICVCHCFPAKKQSSSDFMAAVIICSDFGAQEEDFVTASTFSPTVCDAAMGPDVMILVFFST